MPVCRDEFWEFRPNEAISTWWFTGVLISATLMTVRVSVSTSGTRWLQEHEISIVHWLSPRFWVCLPPYPGCDWFPQIMSRYHHQSWHQDVRHVVALVSKSWDVTWWWIIKGSFSLISISLLFEWINASMQCDAMDHSKESAWKMINLHFLAHYLLVGPVILMQYFQTKLLLPAQHKGVLIYLWQHNEHWQLHAVTNKDRYANMRHRKK